MQNDMKQTIIGAVVSAIVSLCVVFVFMGMGASDISVGKASRAFDVDMQILSMQFATSSDAITRDGSNWKISGMAEGTCNLSQSTAGSHAATSSKEYFCAFTGARSGDTVIVGLPAGAGAYTSGAQSPLGGFITNGNGYATTSNVIGVNIVNLTGTATSSFIQATTTVRILIVR